VQPAARRWRADPPRARFPIPCQAFLAVAGVLPALLIEFSSPPSDQVGLRGVYLQRCDMDRYEAFSSAWRHVPCRAARHAKTTGLHRHVDARRSIGLLRLLICRDRRSEGNEITVHVESKASFGSWFMYSGEHTTRSAARLNRRRTQKAGQVRRCQLDGPSCLPQNYNRGGERDNRTRIVVAVSGRTKLTKDADDRLRGTKHERLVFQRNAGEACRRSPRFGAAGANGARAGRRNSSEYVFMQAAHRAAHECPRRTDHARLTAR